MQYATFICTMPGQALYGFPFDVPLPNASLTVYLAGTTTKATLYLKDGTTPLGNPFNGDITGIGKFKAADGAYDILIQSADLQFSAPVIESYQMFDFADLNGISNLSALGTTGMIARTGATSGVSDYASRTITGTSGKITVTNGDGVSGDPTISIPSGAIGNTEMAAGAAVANIGFTPENVANKSTDGTFAANSDTNYPSQKAAKTYTDAAKAAATAAALAGNFTGSLHGNPLSTDTFAQGQAYVYDTATASFKAKSIENVNYLMNSAFDIWQENTSYAVPTTSPKVFVADGWKAAANSGGGSGYVGSRVAGISNSQYAIKFQRTAGDTRGTKIRLVQQLGAADSMFLAGKTVVVSFDFTIGANYSQTAGPFTSLLVGTGIDEDVALNVGTANFATGGTTIGAGTVTFSATPAFGTTVRCTSAALTIPTGTTEIAVVISIAAAVGTAGADDSFTIGCVKLEVANIATPYRKPLMADEIVRVKRRYETSFTPGTVPAQNVGTGTGELRWRRGQATTGKEGIYQMFAVEKRSTPAITLANPAAADAQVRNITGSADCTLSTAQNITQRGFEIDTTGNSGGAVGDTLATHWIADARL